MSRPTLFADYGTVLSMKRMELLCPTAKPIAKGWLFDHRLVFKGSKKHGYGHATVIQAPGELDKAVPIVVWELTEQDEETMDKHHGVSTDYYRKTYTVLEVDGKDQSVLLYVLRDDCEYALPSKPHMDTITKGYLDFGFPMTTLEEAVAETYHNTIVYEKEGGEKIGQK